MLTIKRLIIVTLSFVKSHRYSFGLYIVRWKSLALIFLKWLIILLLSVTIEIYPSMAHDLLLYYAEIYLSMSPGIQKERKNKEQKGKLRIFSLTQKWYHNYIVSNFSFTGKLYHFHIYRESDSYIISLSQLIPLEFSSWLITHLRSVIIVYLNSRNSYMYILSNTVRNYTPFLSIWHNWIIDILFQ